MLLPERSLRVVSDGIAVAEPAWLVRGMDPIDVLAGVFARTLPVPFAMYSLIAAVENLVFREDKIPRAELTFLIRPTSGALVGVLNRTAIT